MKGSIAWLCAFILFVNGNPVKRRFKNDYYDEPDVSTTTSSDSFGGTFPPGDYYAPTSTVFGIPFTSVVTTTEVETETETETSTTTTTLTRTCTEVSFNYTTLTKTVPNYETKTVTFTIIEHTPVYETLVIDDCCDHVTTSDDSFGGTFKGDYETSSAVFGVTRTGDYYEASTTVFGVTPPASYPTDSTEVYSSSAAATT